MAETTRNWRIRATIIIWELAVIFIVWFIIWPVRSFITIGFAVVYTIVQAIIAENYIRKYKD